MGGVLADLGPATVVGAQSIAQLLRLVGVEGVRGQVVAHDVQRGDDALVAVEVEEELAMVGDNVLELFDVGGRRRLGFLRAFGELEPLLEAPEVVVDLLPIALRAEWACEAAGITDWK